MYKLRLDPSQVRGVGKTEYRVLIAYSNINSCAGCKSYDQVGVMVDDDVANLIGLNLDTGIATILGYLKDDFSAPLLRANPDDVIRFPCGCVIQLLSLDMMAELFTLPEDWNEPWDVEYASVHVIDER